MCEPGGTGGMALARGAEVGVDHMLVISSGQRREVGAGRHVISSGQRREVGAGRHVISSGQRRELRTGRHVCPSGCTEVPPCSSIVQSSYLVKSLLVTFKRGIGERKMVLELNWKLSKAAKPAH